jgi:hypothetical protein
MRGALIIRALIPALLVVCLALCPASAAELAPADFHGLWKFDPERTREQFGYGSVPPGSTGTGLLEINIPERYVALSLSNGAYSKKTIFAAEVVKDLLLFHGTDGSTMQLPIINADALIVQEGRTRTVFVRQRATGGH